MKTMNPTRNFIETYEKLKYLRLLNGYSQKNIAEMLGVSQALINYIEKGDTKVNDELKKGFARIFGINIEDLFFNDDIRVFAQNITDLILKKAN